MPKPEALKPLSSHLEDQVRFHINVPSIQFDYFCDATELKHIARFAGFAEVRVMSDVSLPNHEKEGPVTTKVSDLAIKGLPRKAQWRKLQIYIDLKDFEESTVHSYTEQERSTYLELLIKSAILKEGADNLHEIDVLGLLVGDVFGFLICWLLVYQSLTAWHVDTEEYKAWLQLGTLFIKVFLSLLDTAIHYQQTQYGARYTILESTERYKTPFLKRKIKAAKLIHIQPKK